MSGSGPQPAGPLLDARDVVVALGGRRVLHGVSMRVQRGEVLAVVGPNGGGKTTLLRAAAGLVAAGGIVRWEGVGADAVAGRDRARRVAWLPQMNESPAGFRVADLIETGRYAFPGEAAATRRRAVRAALERVGAAALLDRPLETLSGGELQKVFLASILVQEAPLLLLDEPTVFLDPGRASEIRRVLFDVAAGGCGVVVATHDLRLARAADRVLGLRAGEAAFEGPPAEAATPAALAALYGVPAHELEAGTASRVDPAITRAGRHRERSPVGRVGRDRRSGSGAEGAASRELRELEGAAGSDGEDAAGRRRRSRTRAWGLAALSALVLASAPLLGPRGILSRPEPVARGGTDPGAAARGAESAAGAGAAAAANAAPAAEATAADAAVRADAAAAAARAESFILTQIRIPRTILAGAAGAALACTGAAFQALFRNPLATPYTLGVASGAAFGAVAALLLGLRVPGTGTGAGTAGALAGAAGVTALAWLFARRRGGLPTTTLLLAGVTLSFLFSALVLLLQYLADFTQAFRILRWLLGEVRIVGYGPLAVLAPLALAGGVLVLSRREELHVLAAGEELARARGVDLRAVTRAVFLGSSALVGGVVALCGPIGFVGLVVPHALRRIVGPDLRVVLPASVPTGAAFLVVCDTVARTALAPVEIPVGVVTALLGGPFFLVVLLRSRTPGAE